MESSSSLHEGGRAWATNGDVALGSGLPLCTTQVYGLDGS